MKSKLLSMILAAAMTVATSAAFAAGELHIYNWGNYTNPEMIEKLRLE